eukprot:sb/3470230/
MLSRLFGETWLCDCLQSQMSDPNQTKPNWNSALQLVSAPLPNTLWQTHICQKCCHKLMVGLSHAGGECSLVAEKSYCARILVFEADLRCLIPVRVFGGLATHLSGSLVRKIAHICQKCCHKLMVGLSHAGGECSLVAEKSYCARILVFEADLRCLIPVRVFGGLATGPCALRARREYTPDHPPVLGYTKQNRNSILDWIRIVSREGEAL